MMNRQSLRCIAWLFCCVMLQAPLTHCRLQAAEPIKLDARVEAAERQRIAAVGRAVPSTVSIFVPGGGGGGSGVLISPDGYALTNFTFPVLQAIICAAVYPMDAFTMR